MSVSVAGDANFVDPHAGDAFVVRNDQAIDGVRTGTMVIAAERSALIVHDTDRTDVSLPARESRSVVTFELQAILKRLLDLVIALVACVILIPLVLVIVILIKRDDSGPIIHRRRVIGRGGVEFDAYKFRTMIVDADTYFDRHPDLKLQYELNVKLMGDPRITRYGKFLRRSSLDELPQFINVLRGEMSVVGPRMIHPSEAVRYGAHLTERLSVRPGITGAWQVSGRQNLSYEDRVRIDLDYVRRRTLLTDIKILLLTIPVVLIARGAH